MRALTVVIPYSPEPFFKNLLISLRNSDLVETIFIVAEEPVNFKMDRCPLLISGPLTAQETLSHIIANTHTNYLLLIPQPCHILIEPDALMIILKKASSTMAGLVYSDFYVEDHHRKILHPLNDFLLGSVRDDFDFGGMILLSLPAIKKAQERYGFISMVEFAGLYDLRLKISIDHLIYHLKEPLYSIKKYKICKDEPSYTERLYAYLDPKNIHIQKEMEEVFTDYLKKIGAYLKPNFRKIEKTKKSYPVEASIIIPVFNRRETISEAVMSALSQKTDFPFNVIVVDNYSTDGTTSILSRLSRKYPKLKHIIPKNRDNRIGGCWNEAIFNEACGRYAVQLDSDDLYSSTDTLQKIINTFREENFAMVIGSYTLVDFNLNEIPPGLIDHREWTDENGHNNALRINGLGAPRAFDTELMRKIKFLNLSYGEDYGAALRICREYKIGRIYESLYLCRRWQGNTDAGLSLEEINLKNRIKDEIRTNEILIRQKMNQGS